MGTPAEEGGGGKIDMINANCFDDVDVAMMVHPSPIDAEALEWLTRDTIRVKFHGKAAHASAFPWDGVNALDAAVLCYQNVSCMRQQLKPTWRVHGVIKNGGAKPNIIPELTELEYYARTPSKDELEVLMQKLNQCFRSAADATGCTVEIDWEGRPYFEVINNYTMANLYKKNATHVGVDFDAHGAGGGGGEASASTDMGNVSYVVPSIHPMFYIGALEVNHTRAFTAAAGDPKAQPYTLAAGKALAMTALDIFTHPGVLQDIKEEFYKTKH